MLWRQNSITHSSQTPSSSGSLAIKIRIDARAAAGRCPQQMQSSSLTLESLIVPPTLADRNSRYELMSPYPAAVSAGWSHSMISVPGRQPRPGGPKGGWPARPTIIPSNFCGILRPAQEGAYWLQGQGQWSSGGSEGASSTGGSTNTSILMTEVPCTRRFCPDTSSLKRSLDSVAGAR